MIRKLLTVALLAATVHPLAGCRHSQCRAREARPTRDPDALGAPIPPRVTPLETIPSTGIAPEAGTEPIRRNFREPDSVPPREVPDPLGLGSGLPDPAAGVLGDPIASAERREAPFPPVMETTPTPKLLVPEPLPADVLDRKEPLPLPPRPGRADLPPPVAAEQPRERSATELPEFAQVLDRVSTSRKPRPDGFGWLKANGYKTVAYLHEPEAKDVASARELAEKQGLTFVAIPVSPEELSAAYTAFADLVKEARVRPLHVFATSGNRTGALWYLAFRKLESLPDDAARVRAGKLGLQSPTDSSEAKRFWLAITDFLSNR